MEDLKQRIRLGIRLAFESQRNAQGARVMLAGPDPRSPYPVAEFPRVGFLKALVKHPLIEIGDFSYYDDPYGPEHFVERCVLYHHDNDRLVIGKFCAIANGVTFIMNGANHDMTGFSTYPFSFFGNGWGDAADELGLVPVVRAGFKGDTIVGNDVWIGNGATIMPGTVIKDGAIIGARAVVAGEVPPYAIMAGNPARVVRRRFPDREIEALLDIRWWDWSVDKITRNLDAIRGADLAALERAV